MNDTVGQRRAGDAEYIMMTIIICNNIKMRLDEWVIPSDRKNDDSGKGARVVDNDCGEDGADGVDDDDDDGDDDDDDDDV